jgi:hypothetical protein
MPDHINLNCNFGLCNRLAKLFTFLPRARELGAGIRMRWVVNDHCNGNFSDLFLPVAGVQILGDMPRPYIDGWKTHPKFSTLSAWRFGELIPQEFLKQRVSQIYDWSVPTVAVHARRTDMLARGVTSSESMFAHIDTWFPDRNIFLATDNRATQTLFRKRYGERLLLQADVADTKNRRRTSLEAAATDLLTCVAASDFVGSNPSSFSGIIYDFHRFLSHEERLAVACSDGSSQDNGPQLFKTVRGHFDFADLYRDIADRIPDGGTFVELGVLHGRSICYMDEYVRQIGKRVRIVGVDAFRRADYDSVRRFLPPTVELLRSDSAEAAKLFHDGSVDAVFVDADHNAKAVKKDIEAWLPKLTPDGVIAGHDIEGAWKGVKAGLAASGLPYARTSSNCWIHDRRKK